MGTGRAAARAADFSNCQDTGDRRLNDVGAAAAERERPVEQRTTPCDLRLIPLGAILIREQDELAMIEPRIAWEQ